MNASTAGRVAIWVPVALLVTIGALSLVNQRGAVATLADIEHTEQVLQTRTLVLGKFTDALAAARSYLITGDERYVIRGDSLDAEADTLLNLLRTLTPAPEQRARIDALDRVGDALLARYDTLVSVRRRAGLPAAQRLFDHRGDMAAMDSLRMLFREVERAETISRDAHVQTHWRLWRTGSWVLALGLVAALGLAIWLSLLFTRTLAREQANKAEARRQAQFLRAILESMPEAVIATDRGGRVQFVNEAATQSLDQVNLDEPVDQWGLPNLLQWPDGRPVSHEDLPLVRAMRGETVRNVEIRTRPPAPPRIVVASAHPIWAEDAEAIGGVVVMRDETDHRRHQDELARAQAQLAQAQKMEAVGQLAGGIAHDFNNVLTAIVGTAELALMGNDLPPDVREDFEQIRSAGLHAADVTRDLLTLSRKQIAHRETLDPHQVLSRSAQLVRRSLPEDIVLTSEGSARETVVADPTQLQQVILNLALNARDAMPSGGSLHVSVRDEAIASARPVLTGMLTAGAWVVFEVSDTGTGIAPDVMEHMFEPFFTTKGPQKGTGLGLSTVYSIVLDAEGQIDARSTVGAGTTFSVFLPARHLVPAPIQQHASRHDGAPTGHETVLVVEDEPGVRAPICRKLRSLGYEVLEASCGEDALRHTQNGTRVHAVITDLVMPQMGGAELTRMLRRDRPELRVLLMSGYSEELLESKGALSAGSTYLSKPFTLEKLALTLRQVLDAPVARTAAQ